MGGDAVPLVTGTVLEGGGAGAGATPFALALASSRFVSSWWACERRKRPLA